MIVFQMFSMFLPTQWCNLLLKTMSVDLITQNTRAWYYDPVPLKRGQDGDISLRWCCVNMRPKLTKWMLLWWSVDLSWLMNRKQMLFLLCRDVVGCLIGTWWSCPHPVHPKTGFFLFIVNSWSFSFKESLLGLSGQPLKTLEQLCFKGIDSVVYSLIIQQPPTRTLQVQPLSVYFVISHYSTAAYPNTTGTAGAGGLLGRLITHTLF